MRTPARLPLIPGVILFAALGLYGCKDEPAAGPDGSPSDVVFPLSGVRYGLHVDLLFRQTCALAGCHDDGQHTSPLQLTSHANTVYNSPIGTIIPTRPDESNLVLRIENRLGQRMPLNRNPLNQNQINGIRTWIAEGAQNN
ncbi:MAG: hypothetical protein WB626_12755 [Bacteroidota bacterium]